MSKCDYSVQEIRNLRYEACRCFRLTEDELSGLIASSQGKDSVWNFFAWGEWEWRYGWPQAVAEAVASLKAKTVLDYGAGVGVVPLYLFDKLGLQPVMIDRPGRWREFLAYRCGRRNIPAATNAEIGPTVEVDVTMALETLEHLEDGAAALQILASHARIAVIISGAMGRPESDKDPLHVFKKPLAPMLLEMGFSLWRGGGTPWVFVRNEVAQARGLQLIGLDGKAL